MCSVATVTKSSGWDGGGGTSELKCARHRSVSSGPAQYLQSINPLALLLSQDHPAPQVVGSLWAGVEDAKQRGVVGLEAARRRRFASDKAASTTQDGTTAPLQPPACPLGTIASCTPPVSPRLHWNAGRRATATWVARRAEPTATRSEPAMDSRAWPKQPTVTPKPPSRILRDARDTLPSRARGRPALLAGNRRTPHQPRAGSGHHGDGQRAIGEDAARP